MSPATRGRVLLRWSFPRVSGDEPDRLDALAFAGRFSPRERG